MANQPEIIDIEIRGHTVRAALKTKLDRAFWTRWLANGWEQETFAFVENNVQDGTVFVDIGAWIGPISLYAAALGARVISLEPDPVAYSRLTENVQANSGLPGSIELIHTAFGAHPGKLRIFGNRKGFGTSGSSSIGLSHRWITVPVTTPNDLIKKAGSPANAVIKVDIEAHEYFCANALAQLRRKLGATMQLSLHPALLSKSMWWRRIIGSADHEALRRTNEVLREFNDCELSLPHLPYVNFDDAVRASVFPEDGNGVDLSVLVRPR